MPQKKDGTRGIELLEAVVGISDPRLVPCTNLATVVAELRSHPLMLRQQHTTEAAQLQVQSWNCKEATCTACFDVGDQWAEAV